MKLAEIARELRDYNSPMCKALDLYDSSIDGLDPTKWNYAKAATAVRDMLLSLETAGYIKILK